MSIDEKAFQRALLDLGAQDDFNAWNLDDGNIRFLVGRYEAAKSADQPDEYTEYTEDAPFKKAWECWRYCTDVARFDRDIALRTAIENYLANTAKRQLVAVDDIDAEIAIAEAILLMPRDHAYEEKGVPVLQYLKKLGYQVMRIQREGEKP